MTSEATNTLQAGCSDKSCDSTRSRTSRGSVSESFSSRGSSFPTTTTKTHSLSSSLPVGSSRSATSRGSVEEDLHPTQEEGLSAGSPTGTDSGSAGRSGSSKIGHTSGQGRTSTPSIEWERLSPTAAWTALNVEMRISLGFSEREVGLLFGLQTRTVRRLRDELLEEIEAQ